MADLVPGIRSHLRYALPSTPLSTASSSERSPSSMMGNVEDYATLFKELFCAAAKDLADMIQEPLEDIGVLSDSVMSTGTLSKTAKLKRHGFRLRNNPLDSAERGESPISFGRGQVLFIIRRASRLESSRLQAAGHRFATITNVVDSLARSMEVTREELFPQLESMRVSSPDERLLAPGVHLGCFAMRPVFHKGFDILVRSDGHNVIPTTFLKKSTLEQWQTDVLERMDNLTVATCCDLLREKRMLKDEREHQFGSELLEGITQLQETVDHDFFKEARLVARLLAAPCSSKEKNGVQQQAFLIAFRVLLDAHATTLVARHQFVPMIFFNCQQHAFKDSPDNDIFARKIYRDFAALAKHSQEHHHNRHASSLGSDYMGDECASPTKKKTWPRGHLKGFDARDDGSSEKNLIHLGLIRPYGGIHVSAEVNVDISDARRRSDSSELEMSNLGGSSEVVVGEKEPESFSDTLIPLTVDNRRKQRVAQY